MIQNEKYHKKYIVMHDIDYYIITNFIPMRNIMCLIRTCKTLYNLIVNTKLYIEYTQIPKDIKYNQGKIIKYCISYNLQKILCNVAKYCNLYNIFTNACFDGLVDVIEWVYDASIIMKKPINIHTNGEFMFSIICEFGYLEVAKWLHEKSVQLNSPIVRADTSCVIFRACKCKQLKLANWLYDVCIKASIPIVRNDVRPITYLNHYWDIK